MSPIAWPAAQLHPLLTPIAPEVLGSPAAAKRKRSRSRCCSRHAEFDAEKQKIIGA